MIAELQALGNYLGNNQLSSYYANQLTAGMDEQAQQELAEIIKKHIKRYTAIPRVNQVIGATTDIQAHLQIIMDLFPTAFFVMSNDLYREASHFKNAKLLQITGIASILTKDPNQTEYLDLFLDSLDPEDSLETLIPL